MNKTNKHNLNKTSPFENAFSKTNKMNVNGNSKYCNVFKNTYFEKHLRKGASESALNISFKYLQNKK